MKKSLFCLLFFIFIISINIQAATIKLVNDNFITTKNWKIQRIYVDNQLSFCLEPGILVGKNSYKKGDFLKQYNKLSSAKKKNINKYALIGLDKYKTSKESGAKTYYYYYYATQELIWDQISSTKIRFKKDLSSYRQKISDVFKIFDSKTNLHNKTYQVSNGKTITLTDNNLKDFTLTNKSEFETSTGLKIAHNNNTLTITNPENNTKVAKATLMFEKYKGKHSIGTSASYTNATYQDFLVAKLENKINLSINFNTKLAKGGFQGRKVDENNNAIKNVEFTYYKDNVKKGIITTDEDGMFIVDNIDIGNYKLIETRTANNLILNQSEYVFKVEEGKITPVNSGKEIVNKFKRGGFKVIKKDEQYNLLEGITFVLYDKDKKQLQELKSDKNGMIKVEDLVFGKYYLKETKTRDDLILDESYIEIDINDTKIIELKDLINYYKRNNLKILKYDLKSSDRVTGATFKVFDLDNNFVTSYKDNDKVVKNLKKSCYYIKEVKAPLGYELNSDNTKKVCLNQTNTVKFYNNKKNQPKLLINKLDSASKKPLSDTVFKVQGNGINKSYITNQRGLIDIKLAQGCYQVSEIKPKSGYILNKNNSKRVCLKSNENKKMIFYNDKNKDYKVGLKDFNNKVIIYTILLLNLVCAFIFKSGIFVRR